MLTDLQRSVVRLMLWLTDRFETGDVVEPWMVLTALVLIAVTLAVPAFWRIVRNVVTIVHEMGHVVMAQLCGRRISGIKVHSDTSGLAITRGNPRGLGVLLTALAGYPAPALVGVVMIWAAIAGHAGAALLVLLLVLALAWLLVRNVWGGLVVTGSLLGAGWIFWHNDPSAVTALVLVLGLFLVTGSVRAAFDLTLSHVRGTAVNSDAVTARANSLVPVTFWLGFYLTVTGAAALVGLGMSVLALSS